MDQQRLREISFSKQGGVAKNVTHLRVGEQVIIDELGYANLASGRVCESDPDRNRITLRGQLDGHDNRRGLHILVDEQQVLDLL